MAKWVTLGFKPHKKGLEKVLGELERDIMKVLWQRGTATVREVVEELRQSRKIAYTTVMTVMGRLTQKGILTRTKQENTYLYRPTYTQKEFENKISLEILGSVLDSYGDSALVSLVDILKKTDPRKIDYLSRLIEAQKAQKISTIPNEETMNEDN